MCYRVATPTDLKEVETEFQAKIEVPELFNAYHHLNGFAGKKVPIIAAEDPKTIQMLSWENPLNFNSLNARSEDIFEKTYWKKFVNRRAILPVTGFYESIEVPKLSKKGVALKTGDKYPYFIYLEGKKIFGLACLISPMNTVSILTTEANKVMAEIHNNAKRMPVILHKEEYSQWLSIDLSQEQMSVIMRPYEAQEMSAHPVAKLLYSKTEDTNVPEVSRKFLYPDASLPVFIKGERKVENAPSLF